MQKIDPAFLYELGSSIRELRELTPQTTQINGYVVMITASDAIKRALDQSIYAFAFRHPTRAAAIELTNEINEMTKQIEGNAETWDSAAMDSSDIQRLQRQYVRFETLFLADLQSAALYLVGPKGGYDTEALIEKGSEAFPGDLALKAPDSISDLKQATRCIAYELPTAAGFHLHRGHESVLRAYWDAVTGGAKRPKDNNMGVYLAELDKLDKGKKQVRTHLRSIKDFHRNPLMHPEQSLESVDEAIDLLAAIRSSIGYMLREIPLPSPPIEVAAV